MSVRSILTFTILLIVGVSTVHADNPVFNDPGSDDSVWFIGYDRQSGNGNKRGDLAIRLRIKGDTDSDETFTGSLIRYGKVQNVTGTDKYIRQDVGGKVIISGTTTKPANGSAKVRKPLRLMAAGTYIANQKVHVVVIRGVFHAGNKAEILARDDAGYAEARSDDRIIIHVSDKTLGGQGGGGNSNNGNGSGNVGSSGGITCRLDGKSVFVSTSTLDEENMTLVTDPCEEEPDVDILEEQTLPEDPPYGP